MIRQQDSQKVVEAHLSGPASTASLQMTQLKCIPCAGEGVNPRARGAGDKPPTGLRISSGILTRLAWDPRSMIMTGIT